MFTTYRHLVSRLILRGDEPSLPLYASMAWIGNILPSLPFNALILANVRTPGNGKTTDPESCCLQVLPYCLEQAITLASQIYTSCPFFFIFPSLTPLHNIFCQSIVLNLPKFQFSFTNLFEQKYIRGVVRD
jgi:hypothetical protein